MGRLLALVDGSTYSESVCDHTAWGAKRRGSGITLVHVIGHRQGAKSDLSGNIGLGARTALLEELADLDAAQAKLAQKHGRAILEDAKARIEAAGVDDVQVRLRTGDLVETLGEMEADHDIVIIGKRGEAADFAKLHLGSNLERVVRGSTLPTLVCSRAFQPIKRFMVAFDGGPSAMKAVEHLTRSRVFPGLACTLLSVGSGAPLARRALDGAAASLREAGYEVTAEIAPGQPDEVIAERIKDGAADVLIMGAYGHSRIRNLIIGSTTTEMVRGCQIPLLLFR
ncbi:MAG: universal stress protein [Rhodobacteraceae bacterium]|nr:universal stress protein [Paracoccaceae bacterium]